MKTKIIIVMLFLMIANIGFSMSAFHITTTRIPFHYIHKNNSNYRRLERTHHFQIIEAYYNPQDKSIECKLYNIGTAGICISNTKGELINFTTTETDYFVSIKLSTESAKENFYLIIDSECIYADALIDKTIT